jgi:hypothetical protein
MAARYLNLSMGQLTVLPLVQVCESCQVRSGIHANQAPFPSVNITESISLKQSWTNSTVSFNSIVKSAPNADSFSLWVDADTKMIYAWGGFGPYGNMTGAEHIHLWAFTPDNEGGGSWAASLPNNPAVFTTLLRGTGGGETSCNGIGFFLSGTASLATDASVSGGPMPLPGLLTYNMSSSTWANLSAPTPYATSNFGQAACLPFGSDGLVMFFGGGSNSVTDPAQFSPLLFDNLTFYNPVTEEWFWQLASGEIPINRNAFCSVGVAGTNGTFEM